jgi:hypothetical protein
MQRSKELKLLITNEIFLYQLIFFFLIPNVNQNGSCMFPGVHVTEQLFLLYMHQTFNTAVNVNKSETFLLCWHKPMLIDNEDNNIVSNTKQMI